LKKKILLYLFSLTILNGCIEPTAFLGPAITISNSGNVYQASLSYASNQVILNSTGKTPLEHLNSLTERNDLYEDINKDISKNFKYNEKKPEPVIKSKLENFRFSTKDQFILF
jgi:hypothetical protein